MYLIITRLDFLLYLVWTVICKWINRLMYVKYFLLLTPPSLSGDPLWELKEKEGRKKSKKVTNHLSTSFWNQVLCYSAELKYWRRVFKENLFTSTYQNTYSLTNHTLTDTAAQQLFKVNLSVLCTATNRLNTPGKLSHWKKVFASAAIIHKLSYRSIQSFLDHAKFVSNLCKYFQKIANKQCHKHWTF